MRLLQVYNKKMVNDQLRAYVKSQLEKGVKPEALKAAILKAGWPPADVEEAMQPEVPAATPVAPSPVPVETSAAPVSTTAQAPAAAEFTPAVSPKLITPMEFTVPKGAPVSDISPASSIPPASPASPTLSSSLPSAPSASAALPAAGGENLTIPRESESSLATPEVISINSVTAAAKSAGRPFSPILASIIFFVCVGVGGAVWWYFTPSGSEVQPIVESEDFSAAVPIPAAAPEEEVAAVTSIPPALPAEDPDIAAAKEVFEKIREANVKKDVELQKQYSSAQTLEHVTSAPTWKPVWYKDLEFVSAVKQGDVVLITINYVRTSGVSSTVDTVFVKEKEGWKFGSWETLQRTLAPAKTSAATGTAASIPTSTSPGIASTSTKPTPTSTPQ
jgi:hypothetical protein